jgi:PKD repeat protein
MIRARSLFLHWIVALAAIGSAALPAGADALRTVYTASASGDAMYPIAVGSDGSLAALGSFSLSSDPEAVTTSPDGQHVYVARGGSDALSVYNVGIDGTLQYASAVATGATPVALAITPSGRTLFSADASGGLSGFAVASDGSLSASGGGGATLTGASPEGLAISPDGGLLFVTDALGNKVKVFSIGVNAELSPVGEADTGGGPVGVAVPPAGGRVFVANAGTGTISGFAVSSNGDLSALPGSPYAAAAGVRGLALNGDGSRLLAANDTAGTVASYSVASDGSLSATGSTSALAGASVVAFNSDGSHAYAAGNGVVRALDVSSSGTLTKRGTDIATTGQHRGLALTPNQGPTAVIDSALAAPGNDSTFEGGHSYDPDGAIANYEWDFGDGTKANGQQQSHTYVQAGQYQLTLTVTDNAGCSSVPKFTGQITMCNASSAARLVQTITIADPPAIAPPDPPCIHDGNDGYCGTPDQKAPQASIVGINNGASITTVDAPDQLVGVISPDPSGIKSVILRFTKAAGFKTVTKSAKRCRKVPVRKGSKRTRTVCKKAPTKICHKVAVKRGSKKKTVCKKRKKAVQTRVALCDTVADGKNYFVRKTCTQVGFMSIGGDTVFRYSLPVALGIGTYNVEVLVTDNAGNEDVLEDGRDKLTFKVVNTPSNQDSGGGTITPPITTTPSTPIDDTGSPFG